jgi:hypothetical protein
MPKLISNVYRYNTCEGVQEIRCFEGLLGTFSTISSHTQTRSRACDSLRILSQVPCTTSCSFLKGLGCGFVTDVWNVVHVRRVRDPSSHRLVPICVATDLKYSLPFRVQFLSCR